MSDCWLNVDGARFADTGTDLAAGVPTVLAELQVTWGRSTTVDQPEPATCRFVVADRTGGATFLDAVDIGATVDVWAAGDIGTGAPTDVAVDGGFETLAAGASGYPRVTTSPQAVGTVVVAAPVHSGARAIQTSAVQLPAVVIPPAAFSGTISAWDTIPRFQLGQPWDWSLAVLAPRAGSAQVYAAVFDDPADTTPVMTGNPVTAPGDGTWHVVTGAAPAQPGTADQWLGLVVTGLAVADWLDVVGTWAESAGTWTDYGTVWIDDQKLFAPPGALPRNVLVFSGRVTDLAAEIADVDGTLRVEATAVDQMADLQNRYVGDTPWPAETVAQRFAAIISASGADVDTRLDATLSALTVSRRDVDNQPAGGLLTELSQGVDGVLWSATHATTGPFLWLEDPAGRATLGTLTMQGGLVVIVPATSGRAPGTTPLDGSDLPDDGTRWVRDVTDVVTRVDATWLDQSTTPDVTERSVRVVDTPAEQTYGVRRYGTSTPLINATDATNVANRVLARTRHDEWRVEGLEYDLGLTPPARGDETANALDLLDGTIRLGRPVVVSNVTRWPGGDTIGVYLEGGVYLFDGVWRLGLVGSPSAGMGASGGWTTLDPAWQWAQMDPDVDWYELWGVTGPITQLEGAA